MKTPQSLYKTQLSNLSALFPLTTNNHIKIDFGNGLKVPFVRISNHSLFIEAWPMTVNELIGLVGEMNADSDPKGFCQWKVGDGYVLAHEQVDTFCYVTKGSLNNLSQKLTSAVMMSRCCGSAHVRIRMPTDDDIVSLQRTLFSPYLGVRFSENYWTAEEMDKRNDSLFERVRFAIETA